MAAETTPSQPTPCFLCALDAHPCAVPSLEGSPIRVAERAGGAGHPAVRLTGTARGDVTILLPDHTRPLLRNLAALSEEQRQALRLRAYHLWPIHPDATTAQAPGPLRVAPAGAIVLEPDLLLNITDINTAEYCARQYPLRRMIPSPPTEATLRGTIIHQAFKELLKSGEAGDPAPHLARALRAAAPDLALRQLSAGAMADAIAPHLGALARWSAQAHQSLWGGEAGIRAETFRLAPEVGLKGRLDILRTGTEGEAFIELKTGEVRAELPRRQHRWQVHGYQTLLAVRHPERQRRAGATLLYSGTPGQAEGYGIPFSLRELHRVLDLRNRLAVIHATGAVPPPPGPRKCARCALRVECARASALLGWEPPTLEDAPPPVAPADAAWFAAEYARLRLEARATESEATQLWRVPTAERIAAGSAIGGLIPAGEPHSTASGEWEYTFRCAQTSELREGDAILLSDGDPIAGEVVSGSILRMDEAGLTVWTPERISHPALIDRYGSEIVHDRVVRNLWRWLEAEPRLRALVAGDLAPTFDDGAEAPIAETLPPHYNAEQRQAIARALAARDYLLIQGPPGTGKTAVVAEIARRAIARGERVLVAAFTNQAVDNVLRRLVAEGARDFIRLGHELSVAPDLHGYRLAARAATLTRPTATDAYERPPADAFLTDDDEPPTPEALRAALARAPLVAATTATWSAERHDEAGDPLRFDLAIIDEATQLTLPAILGALRFARRFVLVGDERQLPPLVVSEEAANLGLKRSLFQALLARWGTRAGVALEHQYRMHPVICGFPSQAFYGGKLLAAGAAREALLPLALPPTDPMAVVLDPTRPLVFVDVPEDAAPGKVSPAQAKIAAQLALSLRAGGIPAERIGIIAPYRAQVAAIRQRLAAAGEREIQVDTVDRFQGGEREVILFSAGGEAGATRHGRDFLADPHRLNVALTRAQRKLIVLGSRAAFARIPLLARLLDYCAALYDGRGGVVTARRG